MQDAHGKMMQTYYGQYNSVHTNNNLAIVLIALLFGWPDFENIITTGDVKGISEHQKAREESGFCAP